MKTWFQASIATTALLAGFALGTPSATAATPTGSTEPGATASFEGKRLDLKRQGWGQAQSCVVFSRARTDCFRSNEEANRAIGYDRTKEVRQGLTTTADFDCARDWLCLFEHAEGRGRRLIFNEDVWHNLADWDFANKTSSWRNRMFGWDDGILGDGKGHVLILESGARAAYMGGWNDAAVHVHG
ncbi:peptidase inhibitor family I36 [Herbihabitans rhizosphaerae]|uniref:Peptidase inhibitor family I36 n=1 Tax=Herbihabitans rhizosphaerae TaxID=1872711 RepID=A0A4Q7KD20_9PSEU|nr:peptidase inhibitor family I36 protein [Herbihabitans rhizosphaerae]RZS31235.1 peptidase inhibitor family I36 [Herbihabitans rhizosphaerae]